MKDQNTKVQQKKMPCQQKNNEMNSCSSYSKET